MFAGSANAADRDQGGAADTYIYPGKDTGCVSVDVIRWLCARCVYVCVLWPCDQAANINNTNDEPQ